VLIGAAVVVTQQHSSSAQEVYCSFSQFWFLASLFFAVVAFVFCGMSFYRRDLRVGLYSLVG
jgi:hypothetical protein